MDAWLLTLAQLGTIAVAYLVVRYVILPIYRTGALDPAIEALRKVDTDVSLSGQEDSYYYDPVQDLPDPNKVRGL